MRAGPARAGILLAVLAWTFAAPQQAITRGETPAGCLQPNRHLTMYAVELPDAGGKPRLAYGLTPDTASIPGPTIEMLEGECLAITLVNDVSAATLAEIRDDPILGDPNHDELAVSLHVHGVKYTPTSDGTKHTGSFVRPGETRTFTWYAAPRAAVAGRMVSQGTAGYWWYHDHLVGTHHGTGGAASGLFGALVVRRPTDLRPDRSYVVGMGPNTTINLRKDPDCEEIALAEASNTCFVAREGERVEFVVIGFGDDFHTFHLHGHNWADNRTGILASMLDETAIIDNKTVGPADTFGFQIIAGEEVGPGSWMLHCHVQTHSDKGMSSFLHVLPADGTPEPAPTSTHEHG